jgi:hypothetical protein
MLNFLENKVFTSVALLIIGIWKENFCPKRYFFFWLCKLYELIEKGASFLVTNTDALNCWLGTSGGATAAASAACAAGTDTCKVNLI